ncbi:Cytochrome P450 76C4 [Raphanus sativus]|uniref:Cytochrome P450 76C1-like n=1 Tax=Raphanus sativus TaxID=3726 RepID=A0A6J0NE03_RAPSA|nr:cytochrome P450 76C1-like [Raphanus sativus]KAJ4905362.1 Cytochrome P450 76C4 [Raphanus sativus]
MEAALFLIFCFLLSYFLLAAAIRSQRRSTALPPGPPGWPIIGNILQIGKAPHRSLADLSKIYGPVMGLRLGSLTTVIISSPEAAREVLKTHDQVMSGRIIFDPVRSIDHQDVSMAWLPSTSLRWRLWRKISATHMFSPQCLDATKSVRMKKVNELVTFISEICKRGESVDIARASFVTSLNIISNTFFSTDLGSYDPRTSMELQDSVVRIMETIGKPNLANYFPLIGFLDMQGIRKEMKVCSDVLFQVFQGFIDARNNEKSSRNESDLLDSLMDLVKENGSELNMNDIKHFLYDLFLGGTDTNSTVVEWAMAELLLNPKKMAKAQAELDDVVGPNGVVQESHISDLPYLQAIVKETLRLHPPGPLLAPHKAETNVEVLGFLVPKNAQVLVNAWYIGRDPSVWENTEQFEPERFMLGREIDVKGRDFELIPFGAGRRICPGMSLAMKTVSLIIASLLHSFEWKLPNGVLPEDLNMDESFGLTLHKTNPLFAVPVKKRANG